MMSFTRAARWLHIGQPTLTVQVKALEERYGVELFVRSARALELSPVGRALFEITKQIFFFEEQAVSLLGASGDAVAGTLRVGSVGPYFVMRLLAAFQDRYPLVQIGVDSDHSDGVVRKVLDSTTDVAITGSTPEDPRLFSHLLGRHEVVLFVNAAHPWAGLEQIELRRLDGQRLVVREPGSMTRSVFERCLDAHGVRPRIVMELARDAVREAVFEGLGIGIVSASEFRAHEALRVIRIADHPVHTHAWLVCLRARRALNPIAAFVDLAIAQTAAGVDA
jgi:aminoethylphosphonate catabolism LysR family transcriptional regulator